MLSTPRQVVWALITYTDWWQPSTSSVYQLGNRRDSYVSDGIRGGLLDTLSERDELCRRMQRVPETNRRLLYLWYLRQLPVDDIARELRLSRRQCFRRRVHAIKTLVELGNSTIVENIPA
jgi:DNA-directed RNA polymerase specialized sigma24 family protein